MAMTASPTCTPVETLSPTSSTIPAASMPGTYGGGSTFCCSAREPFRAIVSVGFTAAACIRTRTWPGPAWTSGISTTSSASGPPCTIMPTARMFASLRCTSPYRPHQTQQRTLDSRAGQRHLVAILGQRWRVGNGEGARLAGHGTGHGLRLVLAVGMLYNAGHMLWTHTHEERDNDLCLCWCGGLGGQGPRKM